jgi:hypothetical protein
MLARRGEIDKPGWWTRFRGPPAVAPDRQRHELGTGGEKGAARPYVAWFLHPHRIARVDQQPGKQIKRGLSSGGHHDLLGHASNPAHNSQEARDHLAQVGMPGNIVVAEEVIASEACVPGENPAPCFEREELKLGRTGMEGDASRQRCHARLIRHQFSPRGKIGLCSGARLRPGLVDDHRGRDARARSLPGFDKALGRELIERSDHGVPRNPKRGGSASDRR